MFCSIHDKGHGYDSKLLHYCRGLRAVSVKHCERMRAGDSPRDERAQVGLRTWQGYGESASKGQLKRPKRICVKRTGHGVRPAAPLKRQVWIRCSCDMGVCCGWTWTRTIDVKFRRARCEMNDRRAQMNASRRGVWVCMSI